MVGLRRGRPAAPPIWLKVQSPKQRTVNNIIIIIIIIFFNELQTKRSSEHISTNKKLNKGRR